MANIINRQQAFSTNGTVTAAGLHNLIDTALVNSAIIKNQQEITTIGTADLLLIAPDSVDASLAPRKVTVQNLLDDGLTAGTFTTLNLTGALTYGTATGNRTVSTSATITTGTIPNLTAGTTTSTVATITTGTIPTLTAGTTTGTAGIFTSGTVTTLNSTTGTITNLSTTLAGDFTISQGTATLATSGATAGTYGSVTAIPFLTIDTKGRITSATTGTFSSTPADGSITFAKLSTSATEADNVAKRTAKAWVNFDGTGTVAIRTSFNVSSITDNGTGDYTINFTATLADGDYAVFGTGKGSGASDGACVWIKDSTTPTSSAVNILTGQPGRAGVNSYITLDNSLNSVLIFR
jgi:hypothetical protein